MSRRAQRANRAASTEPNAKGNRAERRANSRMSTDDEKRASMPDKLRVPIVENFIDAKTITRAELFMEDNPTGGDPITEIMVRARRMFKTERGKWCHANGVDPFAFAPALAPYWQADIDAMSADERSRLARKYTQRVPRGTWFTGHDSRLYDANGQLIERTAKAFE